MKLEQQVVSLELAKQLKSLGVKQESLFYWVRHYYYETNDYIWGIFQKDDEDKVNEQVSAFSVAELGEMFGDNVDLFIKAYGEVFNFKGTERIGNLGVMNLIRKPNMLAKMLIWLIENKYLVLPVEDKR